MEGYGPVVGPWVAAAPQALGIGRGHARLQFPSSLFGGFEDA
jgi:hypothetical protein